KFGLIRGAPRFPSLRAEGQPGGGHDVELPFIGRPLFLQFKLSHYLWRSNASEWDLYGRPYYRIYLRPLRHSKQHNLLIDLEQGGNDVYYVAPEFYAIEELDEYYSTYTVSDHSSFFSPLEIGGLPDDDYHYLTFITSDNYYDLHSNQFSEKRRRFSKVDLVERLSTRLQQQPFELDNKYFHNLANKLIMILSEYIGDEKRVVALKNQIQKRELAMEKARFVSYLARTYIDAEFIILS
ncbi:unnamed protein product, partial [marine sediment metagenome]